jgi:hypothetical protein
VTTIMTQYSIVKHDLESFAVLPGYIWRTDIQPPQVPVGFRQINLGDRWIEFAYVKNEHERKPCSLITGSPARKTPLTPNCLTVIAACEIES